MSDNYDRMALLAAAPIQARWDDSPVIPLIAAPCLAPLSRYAHLPLMEGW
ncbi:MAG: hypothetical protein L3K02_05125 [Thermoplasmata archaeon]|nr:hypothetical protein [Thermoplasmata archaeon]